MVQKFSYNWLCDYLPTPAPAPELISELLTFHAFEVEDTEKLEGDTVISLKILPDRGSDCLCHRGVAREIATLIDIPLKYDPLLMPLTIPATDKIKVTIEDTVACPRFTASLITGIKVGSSPQWLKDRLEAIGTRSINNVVDATNYVMYAIGQPLHAYDATKFPKVNGSWQFLVRTAVSGEAVSLLPESGKTEDRIVTLAGGELLIVDGSTNKPIGLAGVKGGRFAGVDVDTTDVIIEAAHFHPGRTRTTARGLGIVIEASKRFENEPSRALPPLAQEDIVTLIIKIAGGDCIGMIDYYPNEKHPLPVIVHPDHVCALLGVTLDIKEMMTILRRVGVTVELASNGSLICTGPIERTDLNIPEDFIEEIGRVYGYHHIVSVVPETVPLIAINARHYYSELVRDKLISQGFSEVVTSTFRDSDEIGLLSSLASDKSFLRSTLTPAITDVLSKNAPFTDLLGTSDTRVFEIGTVFKKTEGAVTEHFALALGVRVKTAGYTGKEDMILDSALKMLTPILGENVSFTIASGVAEINLSQVVALLPVPTAYNPVAKAKTTTYASFSVYPSVSRDVALWVGEGTEVSAVEKVLHVASGSQLQRLTHLDTFTKEGRTSLAFRLVFQSKEKTLDGSEVDAVMTAVHDAALKAEWEVR